MTGNRPKICLVTGANSGIGKEIVKGLALSNIHIIMVCRNREKGQTLLDEIKTLSASSIDLLIADLSSQAEIRLLAKTIHERYPQLDILINNAGVVLFNQEFSVDGIEMTLATNYLAPFLLTQLLMDLLLKSTSARIINISSAIHKWGKIDLDDLQYSQRKYQFLKAYAQSKLLMNISTFELARRLKGSSITVNCLHPGAVKTNLGNNAKNNFLLKFIDKLVKFFFISPKQAAKGPLYLALSPAMENITGEYFVKEKIASPHPIVYDNEIAKKVWDISATLVNM